MYLNYGKTIHMHVALVQAAGKDASAAEASTILGDSLDHQCIRSIIGGRFGPCIQFAAGHPPNFSLEKVALISLKP